MRNFVNQSPGKIFKDFIGWCASIKGRFRVGEFNFSEMSQMLPKSEICQGGECLEMLPPAF